MPSRAVVELIQMCCWYSGTVLNLLPIQNYFVKNTLLVSNRTFGPKITYIWRILILVPWIFTVAELASNLLIAKKNKLTTNIYQLYILFAKSATLSFVYVFQPNALEISHLLNCHFQKHRRIPSYSNQNRRENQKSILLILLFICAGGISCFYTIVISTVVFALPCL